MRLDKIFIKNFRSIGERGLELKFSNKLTTFIGENNVGKSSIFKAISKSLEPNVGWDSEEWHAGDDNKIAEINLLCTLDDGEINELINCFNISLTVSEFKENFTDKIEYKHSRSKLHHSTIFKFGKLSVKGRHGWIGDGDFKGGTVISLKAIINNLKTQNSKNFYQIFEDKMNEHKITHQENDFIIDFEGEFSNNFIPLIKNNLIIIEEFRQRPNKTLSDLSTSPKGQELASVLFNLKNSRADLNIKYKQIQNNFNRLFPMLSLDVIRENNEIKILVQKEGVESTHLYLGAGIIELLLLITHLTAHKDKVIFIDHPESHLHPHAQRRLSTMLEDVNNGQICIITHSPYFVNLNRNSQILRFVQDSAQTKCIELTPDYFTDTDLSKLEQFMDIDTKELFFARKVVLVEGPTEFGALPIFASKLYNFDENGVSVIIVGGKKSFETFVKLCEGFKLPYLVIADQDANENISNLEQNYPNCKSYIMPDEFDDILPENICAEAKNEVGRKSKPRIGKYVASKLVETNNIPSEIIEIIEKIKTL